ncbi:Intercellular adhesion protein R [Nocardia otitidiscaviarum]|uniref:Intercellular adhesion protein R n=1 Tax=Nocardia otitidiscaviarum TaxID=1823 RepID=A0A378YD73_9NOCA|nr:TetR/AcrR family transcriptional regulator [Nocardia otitidiscaviarum]MBF6238136.1 TetR/AcrR family transcriptional regulator [Nocardia otitidiscaviarum]QDP82395.1 TetR/AcrR family transcriptional regulator [Nocardia otitidiscaviarum]SUA75136.1 Intercellular adhesion protein R [Nocardia otitidiscaviarum]
MTGREPAVDIAAGRGTKDVIRDVALRLFSTRGFEQTSLREVADEVGITKASLYYHYSSKQDLLLAVIEPVFADMRAMAAEIDEREYSRDAVREILTRQLRSMLDHRPIGRMFVNDGVAVGNAIGRNYEQMLEMHSKLCRWLAGPDADPEALLRASAALDVVKTALLSQQIAPDVDEELVERVLLDAALGVLIPAR